MKKIVSIVLCLALAAGLLAPMAAATGDELLPGESVFVTLDANATTDLNFSPAESGYYRFGGGRVFLTLSCPDTIISHRYIEPGAGPLNLVAWLESGKTYTVTVKAFETGTHEVYVRRYTPEFRLSSRTYSVSYDPDQTGPAQLSPRNIYSQCVEVDTYPDVYINGHSAIYMVPIPKRDQVGKLTTLTFTSHGELLGTVDVVCKYGAGYWIWYYLCFGWAWYPDSMLALKHAGQSVINFLFGWIHFPDREDY